MHIASQKPPIYGAYRPAFPPIGFLAVGGALLAAAVFFLLARASSIRRWVALPTAVAISLSFSAAVAFLPGQTSEPFMTLHFRGDYFGDTTLARSLGFHRFIKRFPELVPTLASVHSRTHPPGPVVLVALLQRLFPTHDVPKMLVLAFISALALIPTWFIAERMAGKRAALVAVCLLAVSPGLVMFTFTSMDAVFATILATAGALLLWGLTDEGNGWLAFAGGVAAGLAVIMTYAIVFVVAASVIYAFFALPLRRAARMLLCAAAGGVLAIVFLRVFTGFDVLASYRALTQHTGSEGRSYAYWVFGNIAVWLTFAGVPIAALALLAIKRHSPKYVLALVVPLLLFYLLPVTFTHLAPGETERTWLFTQPFLAGAAGLTFARWEEQRLSPKPGVLLTFIILAAAQTIVLQALFYTVW